MINIYIKLKLFLISIFFLNLIPFVSAQDGRELQESNASTFSLEASAKKRSISKTTQDFIQLYRELGAQPKQIASAYMFLAFLGFPNYSSVAPESNLCIFVYGSPNRSSKKYILLAKLIPDSNIQKILENFGWTCEIHSGWAFLTKKKEDIGLIKDKQSVLNFANERSQNEIELTLNPSTLSRTLLIDDINLKEALKNSDKATLSINVFDNQIDINSEFSFSNNKEGFDFGDWLIKQSKEQNIPGLATKILSKDKNALKVNITLERKALNNFCDRLQDYNNKFHIFGKI